jgi:hypothetical protein
MLKRTQVLKSPKYLRYMPEITDFERLNFRTVSMIYLRFKPIRINDDISMPPHLAS